MIRGTDCMQPCFINIFGDKVIYVDGFFLFAFLWLYHQLFVELRDLFTYSKHLCLTGTVAVVWSV